MPVGTGYADNSSSAAYEASRIAKAKSGVCYRITVYNSKGSAQFIQVHDSATLPADNAVPAVVQTVATVANLTIDFGRTGRFFSNGITVCNSSTGPTKTIGSADCWFDVQVG